MRVTLVHAMHTSGGPLAAFVALCNGLAAQGHEVSVIAPAAPGAGLDAEVVQTPWEATGRRWNPWALMKLAAAIGRTRPEVVHAHGDKAAWMVARATRRMRQVAKVASVYSFKRHYHAYRAFDRVIAATAPLAAACGHRQAEVVWPGLAEVPAASAMGVREQIGTPPGVPVVLAAGRWVAANGFDRLLSVWPWVGEAELWLAGAGPEQAALTDLARREGLLIEGGYDRGGRANGVRMLGARADVPALLAACDLAVITAQNETFSHALASALLAGKPAVSTGHPLAAALLPAEYVAPIGEADALREALGCALSDVPRAAAAQAAAFGRAQKELTVAAMAAKTLAVYGRALGAGRLAGALPAGQPAGQGATP